MTNDEHSKTANPTTIRTVDDLRRKIKEVRIRVDEAIKPGGPLRVLKVTTST